MIEIEVNKENLKKFIKNIRKEDRTELEFSFKNKWKEKFIEICLNEKNIWFLADKYNIPCAIGGIQYENTDINSVKRGRIWLICANNFKNNRIYLLRYIKNKIEQMKLSSDILYNYIYKTNFRFLKWLKKIGFKTLNVNQDIKFFYFIKEDNFDTRYITG